MAREGSERRERTPVNKAKHKLQNGVWDGLENESHTAEPLPPH